MATTRREERIIRNATDILARWIDVSRTSGWDPAIEWSDDGYICEVVFTKRSDPEIQVCLSEIWSDKWGNINRSGTNYGRLTM